MTIADYLVEATNRLAAAGIATARLECLVLLEDVLQLDRAVILAHPEAVIPVSKITKLNTFITQRITLVPLAYIRGRAEFYGRTFLVNKHVLVPRPESEAIIDLCKKLPLPARARIADVGTGSGCIGITAALELPGTIVDLCDIDSKALSVARANAELHHTQVRYKHQDLLGAGASARYNVVLANLPYVPNNHPINQSAAFEPKLALFAGLDGLDVYRNLWHALSELQDKPEHIITEALPMQHEALTDLAHQAGYKFFETNGFAQRFSRS